MWRAILRNSSAAVTMETRQRESEEDNDPSNIKFLSSKTVYVYDEGNIYILFVRMRTGAQLRMCVRLTGLVYFVFRNTHSTDCLIAHDTKHDVTRPVAHVFGRGEGIVPYFTSLPQNIPHAQENGSFLLLFPLSRCLPIYYVSFYQSKRKILIAKFFLFFRFKNDYTLCTKY